MRGTFPVAQPELVTGRDSGLDARPLAWNTNTSTDTRALALLRPAESRELPETA
jgi:hypothetical protein